MRNKFKPMKARMRATFSAGGVNEPRLGLIDKDKEVLHDVQITLEGEARGHGIWLDSQFCSDVAEAGNAQGEAGIKVRFGHPSMCSDALGTYIGRATNFRVIDLTRKDGAHAAGVIADIALDASAHQSPQGDLATWILSAAESSPDTFGQSIVFTYADFKVKDADGGDHLYSAEVLAEEGAISEEDWMAKSADGHVYAVLGKLHGTDFTDTPAATDGVFSSDSLAAEAEAMLDEHPEILSVIEHHPDSVLQFLERAGIADKIESSRLTKLQSAKDREISVLQKRLDDMFANDKSSAAALSAVQTERDQLLQKLDKSEQALTDAQAEVSRLTALVGEKDAALTNLGEQLSHCREAAKARGEMVNQIPDRPALSREEARAKLASLPIDERADFYAKHRKEIDG